MGASAATVPVTDGGWTAKDVIAHVCHYAGQLAFGLGANLQPPAYVMGVPGRPTGDEWNARAVAHYRDIPFDQVRAEFERLVAALVAQLLLQTDEQMNATESLPWAGAAPLWMKLAGDTFGHWPVHAEAIERAARSV